MYISSPKDPKPATVGPSLDAAVLQILSKPPVAELSLFRF